MALHGDRVAELARSLGLESGHVFAMASRFDRERAVVLVRWAHVCCADPPMVAVSLRKGWPIVPVIRDSHAFALSLLDPADTFAHRKLRDASVPDEDPLDLLEHTSLRTGSPCLTRALCSIDCEVVRHMDLDGDHEMYIGQIVAVRSPEKSIEALNDALGAMAEQRLEHR